LLGEVFARRSSVLIDPRPRTSRQVSLQLREQCVACAESSPVVAFVSRLHHIITNHSRLRMHCQKYLSIAELRSAYCPRRTPLCEKWRITLRSSALRPAPDRHSDRGAFPVKWRRCILIHGRVTVASIATNRASRKQGGNHVE